MALQIARKDGLDPRITSDPRFSQAQVQAMRQVAETDPRACVMGLDQKLRPVIRAQLTGPDGPVWYALLRNGTPTKVTRPLAESWRQVSRMRGTA